MTGELLMNNPADLSKSDLESYLDHPIPRQAEAFFVYILLGRKKAYVGQTNSLSRRLRQHFRGECITSKRCQVYRLAHYWNVATRYEALKLEFFLQELQRKFEDCALWEVVIDVPLLTKSLLEEALSLPDTADQACVRREGLGLHFLPPSERRAAKSLL
jgi:predicted GIY-YIG superfamily endonuclease